MQKGFSVTLLQKQTFCIYLTLTPYLKIMGSKGCKILLLTFKTFFHEMLDVTISKTFHLPQLHRMLMKHGI